MEHVLEDLQPYTCTFKDCEVADHMYTSRAAFSQHEALEHSVVVPDPDPTENVDPEYLFCNEDIGFDRTERVRHIGRHMEEIAFAVVTKPYEEWDFYSVSSDRYLDGQGPWHSKPAWYPCICHDCGVKLHTVAERAEHFVSIHGLSVAAAQAELGGGHQCHRLNNLQKWPCNTVFSSSMDLKTHVFIDHTEGRKLICGRCYWGKLLAYGSLWISRPYIFKTLLAVDEVQCGLCGVLTSHNDVFKLDVSS